MLAPKTYRVGLSSTDKKRRFSDLLCFVPEQCSAALGIERESSLSRIGFRDTLLRCVNRESNRNGSQRRGAKIGL